ncbi:unnamed protein product [Linum trigynum]|uniref:Uncharacterized protein n=1 Tax=Linum trigynum TaxID=586398 RepID=A0AAV2GC93_9ROSI
MASLKVEKPAIGTQLFGQVKKETTPTKAGGDGAASKSKSKSSAGSKAKKGSAAAAQKPLAQGTKKKGKGGKAAKN